MYGNPKFPGGDTKGGMVHVDAYDRQRHGHSVDVREHYRSRPGAGGWYDGADLGVPTMRYKAINLGLRTLVEPKPEVLRALGLTLEDLVVREKRPLRRQNFEAEATPASARADAQVTSPHAAAKAAQNSPGAVDRKKSGHLTKDGKAIHQPVRASQYVEENAATNKLPREMQPSQELVDALKRNEGKNVDEKTGRHTEYTDSAGYRTIGYGHRLADNEHYPDGITEEQARELFVKDLQIAADRVNRAVKVPFRRACTMRLFRSLSMPLRSNSVIGTTSPKNETAGRSKNRAKGLRFAVGKRRICSMATDMANKLSSTCLPFGPFFEPPGQRAAADDMPLHRFQERFTIDSRRQIKHAVKREKLEHIAMRRIADGRFRAVPAGRAAAVHALPDDGR